MQTQKQENIIETVDKDTFLRRLRELASRNALSIVYNGDSFLPFDYYTSLDYLLRDYGNEGVLNLCDSTELGMYLCSKMYRNAKMYFEVNKMTGNGKLRMIVPKGLIIVEELLNNLPDNTKIEFNSGAFIWDFENCAEKCLHVNPDELRNKYGRPELSVAQVKQIIKCYKERAC